MTRHWRSAVRGGRRKTPRFRLAVRQAALALSRSLACAKSQDACRRIQRRDCF